MGSAEIVDIEDLSRDWISGCSGQEFIGRVQTEIDLLDAYEGHRSLVVIRETDPLAFASLFFAALIRRLPIALANPRWAPTEWQQFEELIKSDEVAPGSILIPTGGTTSGVKLAIHNWDSLLASARGVQEFLGGGPIHSCCLLPLFHVSGLMQLVRSFVSGGIIRFDDAETEGYCLSLVPTQLQRALENPDQLKKLRNARVLFVGGAAIPAKVAKAARDCVLGVTPVYGMTETAAMVSAIPAREFLSGAEVGAIPIGDARFEIVNDGRIRIQTSALFQGYHGRTSPDLTNGFVVNDAGYLDDLGRLHVTGRLDRLINTGGEKVDPREVESALLEVEGLREALVVGEASEEWGQVVKAYVVAEDRALTEEELSRILRRRLSHFKVPKSIDFVEQLPINELGKVTARS